MHRTALVSPVPAVPRPLGQARLPAGSAVLRSCIGAALLLHEHPVLGAALWHHFVPPPVTPAQLLPGQAAPGPRQVPKLRQTLEFIPLSC